MLATFARTAEDHLLKLLEASAKHDKWLESIDHRLDVLNGKVAVHEEKFGDVYRFMSEHPRTCEVGLKVDALAGKLEANRVERKADIAAIKSDIRQERAVEDRERAVDQKWWVYIKPWVERAIVASIVIILLHFKEIIAWLGKTL